MRYECKYTETSAILNNGVDELLAGTLRQIRLKHKEALKLEETGYLQTQTHSSCLHVGLPFVKSLLV